MYVCMHTYVCMYVCKALKCNRPISVVVVCFFDTKTEWVEAKEPLH